METKLILFVFDSNKYDRKEVENLLDWKEMVKSCTMFVH